MPSFKVPCMRVECPKFRDQDKPKMFSFKVPCMRVELDKTLDQLLSDYFTKGFTYQEMQEFLCVHHQQTISLSTIKRYMKKLNLFRRPVERSDDTTLLVPAREALSGSGSNIGYRRVWAHLRGKSLKV